MDGCRRHEVGKREGRKRKVLVSQEDKMAAGWVRRSMGQEEGMDARPTPKQSERAPHQLGSRFFSLQWLHPAKSHGPPWGPNRDHWVKAISGDRAGHRQNRGLGSNGIHGGRTGARVKSQASEMAGTAGRVWGKDRRLEQDSKVLTGLAWV